MKRSAAQQDNATMRGGKRGRVKEVHITEDGFIHCNSDLATSIAQGKAKGHTHYNVELGIYDVDADGRVPGKRYVHHK